MLLHYQKYADKILDLILNSEHSISCLYELPFHIYVRLHNYNL